MDGEKNSPPRTGPATSMAGVQDSARIGAWPATLVAPSTAWPQSVAQDLAETAGPLFGDSLFRQQCFLVVGQQAIRAGAA